MYHVIVLLWFPEIIFFSLCVSNVLFYVNWWLIIFDPHRITEDQLSVALYKHSKTDFFLTIKTSNTSRSL